MSDTIKLLGESTVHTGLEHLIHEGIHLLPDAGEHMVEQVGEHVAEQVGEHAIDTLGELGSEIVGEIAGPAFAGASLIMFAYEVNKEFKEINELQKDVDGNNSMKEKKWREYKEKFNLSDSEEVLKFFKYCKNLSDKENVGGETDTLQHLESKMNKLKETLGELLENYDSLKDMQKKMLSEIHGIFNRPTFDGGTNQKRAEAVKNTGVITVSSAATSAAVGAAATAIGGPIAGAIAAILSGAYVSFTVKAHQKKTDKKNVENIKKKCLKHLRKLEETIAPKDLEEGLKEKLDALKHLLEKNKIQGFDQGFKDLILDILVIKYREIEVLHKMLTFGVNVGPTEGENIFIGDNSFCFVLAECLLHLKGLEGNDELLKGFFEGYNQSHSFLYEKYNGIRSNPGYKLIGDTHRTEHGKKLWERAKKGIKMPYVDPHLHLHFIKSVKGNEYLKSLFNPSERSREDKVTGNAYWRDTVIANDAESDDSLGGVDEAIEPGPAGGRNKRSNNMRSNRNNKRSKRRSNNKRSNNKRSNRNKRSKRRSNRNNKRSNSNKRSNNKRSKRRSNRNKRSKRTSNKRRN